MKKILLGIFMILITGCNTLDNTPTKQVEIFFNNYQALDKEVLNDLDNSVAEEMNFNTEQREKYKSIMKKHYQNLKYEIKDSEENADEATVTVEIEVTDYTKAMASANLYLQTNRNQFLDENGDFDNTKFTDYRLEQLSSVKDKVKYTFDLQLTKKDDKWKLEELDERTLDKIQGIYQY